MASKPETPKKAEKDPSDPISPGACYQDDSDALTLPQSAYVPIQKPAMNASIELQYTEISSPVPSYLAGNYSDALEVLSEETEKPLNAGRVAPEVDYAYCDMEGVVPDLTASRPSETPGGYILDSSDDSDQEERPATLASSSVIGYALYSDESDRPSGESYYLRDETESNVTDDAYGPEDLSEAVLKKSSYLVDDAKQASLASPSEMNFTSAYVGLRISDPSTQLELPVGAGDDELEPTDEDLRGTGLLRMSRSSSSSSLGYGYGSGNRLSKKSNDALYASSRTVSSALDSSQASISNTSESSSQTSGTYYSPGSSASAASSASNPQPSSSVAGFGVSSSSSFTSSASVTSTAVASDGSYTTEAVTSQAPQKSNSRNLKGSAGSSVRSVPSSATLITPRAIQEMLDSKGSWNDRFQAIFDAPDSEAKYDALHRLSVDFLGVAETYGKVIIAELSLPDNEKSIKPINIGGVAGGSKYAVRGLLFKFAVDVPPHFLYGSDEYAQKAAGHELKGLNQWSLNSEGLHFPLMALVRYCGFTLVALSMLPIGNGSLVYGSDDAGRSVHFDDDEMYEKMKQTATALNLKGHYLVADTSKLIYGPGDIEGHYGDDRLHYVLDFARVYPPAALVQGEIKEKSRCLFRLLRPELVSRFSKPLSSDAFTAWGRMNSDVHNAEVRLATQYLVDDVIPTLATQVTSLRSFDNLTRMFHLNGVNIRYMGLVRRVVYAGDVEKVSMDDHPHVWLLREMVARTIKSILNQKWRELIKKYQRITPDRCIQEAIGLLNACVEPQSTPGSIAFWGKTIRDLLNVKFPLALIDTENELDEKGVGVVDLQKMVFGNRSGNTWQFMFSRISELTGIRFGHSMLDSNASFPSFGVLTPGDVLEIHSSVKQMSLVDFAYVMSKSLNGLRQLSPALASRLFGLAIARLREAPEISLIVLRRIIALKTYIVRTLKRMKWVSSMIDAVGELVDVALDGAQLMCNNLPSDLATDAAVFLHEIHASTNDGNKIIQYLERAMATDPTNVRPYMEITKIQAFNARPNLTLTVRKWMDSTCNVAPNDPLVRLQLGLLILTLPNVLSEEVSIEVMSSSGLTPLQEVLDHWTFVKQTDPTLFYQVDLHLFAARDALPNVSSYDIAASQRARSFSALVHVAVQLQCPELVKAIKDALQMDFTNLLFHAAPASPWTAESFALLASCGPFPHFKKVHFPAQGPAVANSAEAERALGNLLACCTELEELMISAKLAMRGELLASIAQPHKLVSLDIPGLELEDAHLEAFCDKMLASQEAAAASQPAPPQDSNDADAASEAVESSPASGLCELKHLLLPNTVLVDEVVRVLHKLGGKTKLEAVRFACYNEQMTEALARHADSLKMISMVDCDDLNPEILLGIIGQLPNLLLFDAAGSNLDDISLVKVASTSKLHPALEFLISSSGTYFMFSAGQKRHFRLTASHSKPICFGLSIYPHEWDSIQFMKYTKQRDIFDTDPRAAPVTFFQCEKSINSHGPQTFSIFGKTRNTFQIRALAASLGHSSSISWSMGSTKVAEVKIPNNLAGTSQLMWFQDAKLKSIIPNASIAHIMRVNVALPGLADQHLIFQNQGGASSFMIPPDFPINFFAIAILSFLRLLPV